MSGRWIKSLVAVFVVAFTSAAARAEDGYDLWLRYRPLPATIAAQVKASATAVVMPKKSSPIIAAAIAELHRGLGAMLGTMVADADVVSEGAILIGTPATSDAIRKLNLPLSALGTEGYLIRNATVDGRHVIVIAANSDVGVLYGAFCLLEQLEMQNDVAKLDISSAPKVKLRVLNHWDNLDRTVERGYAGQSIWDWWRLPDIGNARYVDYARANASIGINGIVLNNVNSKPDVLTASWIAKFAAIADVLRPYGIHVYLSARFSTPLELKETKTADPTDPAVKAWWKAKEDEIYKAIPDIGGFLVKASSEGQPGPGDYGRTHAEGANTLAAGLKAHGGVVFWRAFVYSQTDPDDRAKQAYSEFKPLEGKFADNVIIQVKNGAIDFQPREPFHPLFGAMPKTPIALELQITKEYLGQATHLAYLGTMWEEVLAADTYAKGKGSTVAKVVDGTLDKHGLTAMAGVANVGVDRNWSGSDFNQANWYAYGRLAWDPYAPAQGIAESWLRMTFSNDPAFVKTASEMMMGSREAVANYMTPLGLHHLMATGHHYGPGPWVSELSRPEWNPVYYHKADADGIGFDRTKTGSNALAQYTPEAAATFADPHNMDERYLLWFHHLPWDFKVKSGRTLWDEIVTDYGAGAKAAATMREQWATLKPYVDPERFEMVSENLKVQEKEAKWWRDACIAYFQSVSKLPLPAGTAPPQKTVAEYKAIQFPYAPH